MQPTNTPSAQDNHLVQECARVQELAGNASAEAERAAKNGKTHGANPSFTLEEVALHCRPGDYWTAIGDKVYNITGWIESGKHPGGDLILQGAGRDASVLFETSHPLYVGERMLGKYCIGNLRRPDTAFKYRWHSTFYRTMRTRVEEYSKKNDLPLQDAPLLWLESIYTLFFFFFFWYLAFVQGNLLACIPCGWFHSQLGIVIMHDGNHGAYSKNSWMCRIAGMVMDFMGGSSLVWKHEHNIGHHQFTNSSQDPDSMTAFPLIRYNPVQPWKWFHAYQHYYVWLLYPFICFKWYLTDIDDLLITGKYHGIALRKPSNKELVLVCITKLAVPLWAFAIPCYYYGVFCALALLNMTFMFASYCFALQFVVNHLADGVIFPEEYQCETDWAKCQVMSTSNYSTGNALVAWLSGGLNHQIEHHLFPTVSHVHLARIAPIVQQTCREFGVPYLVHDSFCTALAHHYAHIKRMAQPPGVPVPCFHPLSACKWPDADAKKSQ